MVSLGYDIDHATAAVSGAFIDYMHASKGRHIDHVAAWLLSAAKKKPRWNDDDPSGLVSLDATTERATSAAVTSPDSTEIQRLELDLVTELMRRTALRGHQRSVLELGLQGLNASAIASRLGLSLAVVKRSYTSGCARLLATAQGSHFLPELQALIDRLLSSVQASPPPDDTPTTPDAPPTSPRPAARELS